MKTIKTICAFMFALAIMLTGMFTPPEAKADQPSCNLSDTFSAYDGQDNNGNYLYTDATLGGVICTDPDPIGGIGC
jgi:hypothetical protein